MNIREMIADEIAGQSVGTGYYGTSVHRSEALEQADSLLLSDLMTNLRQLAWIAATENGENVEFADEFWDAEGYPDYIREWVMNDE